MWDHRCTDWAGLEEPCRCFCQILPSKYDQLDGVVQALVRLSFNYFWDFTTSLGNLFWCLTTLMLIFLFPFYLEVITSQLLPDVSHHFILHLCTLPSGRWRQQLHILCSAFLNLNKSRSPSLQTCALRPLIIFVALHPTPSSTSHLFTELSSETQKLLVKLTNQW